MWRSYLLFLLLLVLAFVITVTALKTRENQRLGFSPAGSAREGITPVLTHLLGGHRLLLHALLRVPLLIRPHVHLDRVLLVAHAD